MFGYRCKGEIKTIGVRDDLVAVGCSDGWIHVFDGDGILWSKKLTATYYRDPYTDVNVISADINDKYVAVGTDFMDGKVYLFTLDGELVWYKQFLCIVGCWERPEDMVAVAVDADRVAACSEWLNGTLHVMDMDGRTVKERELDGSVKDVIMWNGAVVGTSRALYLNDLKLGISANKIMAHENELYVSSADGVYAVNGKAEMLYSCRQPLISVSDKFVAVYDGIKLSMISKNGDVIWEIVPDKQISTLYCVNERVYAGYTNGIDIVEGGEVTEKIQIDGEPVHIGKVAVCVDKEDGREVKVYRMF